MLKAGGTNHFHVSRSERHTITSMITQLLNFGDGIWNPGSLVWEPIPGPQFPTLEVLHYLPEQRTMHHVTLASGNMVISTEPGKQTAELAEHVRNRKETQQLGKPRCAQPASAR